MRSSNRKGMRTDMLRIRFSMEYFCRFYYPTDDYIAFSNPVGDAGKEDGINEQDTLLAIKAESEKKIQSLRV